MWWMGQHEAGNDVAWLLSLDTLRGVDPLVGEQSHADSLGGRRPF